MGESREHEEHPVSASTDDLAASEGWLRGLVDQTLAGIDIIQDGYAAATDLIRAHEQGARKGRLAHRAHGPSRLGRD